MDVEFTPTVGEYTFLFINHIMSIIFVHIIKIDHLIEHIYELKLVT